MEEDSSSKEREPLDISDEIAKILDNPNVSPEQKDEDVYGYIRSLKNEPSLSLIMDWRGLQFARWAKEFVGDTGASVRGQKRIASIRCTEDQKNEAANVFASGVKWINSEE